MLAFWTKTSLRFAGFAGACKRNYLNGFQLANDSGFGSGRACSTNRLDSESAMPMDETIRVGAGFPRDAFTSMKYWESEYQERKRMDFKEEVEGPETQSTQQSSDDFYNILAKNAFINSETEEGPLDLTHVDSRGRASMVDVSAKPVTTRTASARAEVTLGTEAFRLVRNNQMAKGDVLTVAQLAGITGAKETSRLIPLCHPLPLTSVQVDLRLEEVGHRVVIVSDVTTRGQTGVEMEALTAVTIAALTVYDMVKAVTRHAEIGHVRLLSKTGGSRPDFHLPTSP